MGNLFANPNEDIVFQGFRNDQANDEMNYEKVCLFGLSGSGKSTLHLNLQQLYDDPDYKHKEHLKHCEAIIRSNCLLYIAILINESQKLYAKTQNDLYFIDTNNKSIKDAINLITRYIPYKFEQYTPPNPLPIINDTKPIKPNIKLKPLPSLTAPSQHVTASQPLPVLEEKKELENLEIGKNKSFESSTEPPQKLDIEQGAADSSAFLTKFNIDDSEQHKDDNFYSGKGADTLAAVDESKTDKNIQIHHGMMESDDASYMTLDNIESNKIKIKNDIIQLGEEDEKQQLFVMQNEYMEELGYLISEYDDLGFFDEMGLDINDIWNYQNNTNWKTKFNNNISNNQKKYQFEPYKSFDFDSFYKQLKEWENKQNDGSEKGRKLKYFDEDNEYSSDIFDDYYTPFKRYKTKTKTKKSIELLNEELIEDFGAYYEYIQMRNKTENSNQKQTEWSEFGHKASIISKYFNMKLNNKSNPIKHEYEIIGDKWWNMNGKRRRNDGEFNIKKLDIVLENKMKIIKLSEYASDSSYDESENEKNEIENKELKYKIPIINGKIKKLENWDTNVMQKKENVMVELVKRKDINVIEEESMEEKKDENESKHSGTLTDHNVKMELKNTESDVNTNKEETKTQESVKDGILVEVNGEQITIKQFWNDMKKLGFSVKKIWNLPSIQEIYKKRHNLFYFPSNMDYWFYNSTKIFSYNFIGTNQHLSLHRNYNTKIETFKFNDPHGPKVRLFDIPATTPEIRNKYWTREYCANCDAIIFTASLIDIFNVSFEDPTQNAFYLSIQLFHEILHSDWLNKGCKIILFLTHRDKLIEYIRNGHSIKLLDQKFKKWDWRPKGYNNKSESDSTGKNSKKIDNNTKSEETVNGIDKLHRGGGSSSKDIDKTLNTIDAMHNTFDRFIQSIEEKENKQTYKGTISMDGDTFINSRNNSLNKERDGTITKFMPELSEDIDILSDDDMHIPQTHISGVNIMEPISHSTKEKEIKNLIVSQSDIMADITKESQEKEHPMVENEDDDRSNIIAKNNDENKDKNEEEHEVEEEEEKNVEKSDEININFDNVICKCPNGHKLDNITCENSNYYMCDECRCDLLENMNQYQCRIDNYDLCEKCHNKLLLIQKNKLKKELLKTPVWIIDKYNGIEYCDRLKIPKSDIERKFAIESEKEKQMNEMRDITPDSKDNIFNEEEEEKYIYENEERKENKILSQFKKQTRKRNKSHENKTKKRNKKLELENDENWKYILSGNKKLIYDGSEFDDERWLIETYDGYCEWMRDQFMKCKPINDQRVIHCHILNLINQDDIGKVMYDLNNYVFTNVFHNDWLF